MEVFERKRKHYALSDVHGMYEAYMAAIRKLNKEDCLFIIGDVIDRGEDGIKIIQDIIARQKSPENNPEITFLIGNHEMMFLQTVNIMLKYGINKNDLIELIENKGNIESFFKRIQKDKGVNRIDIGVIENWINNNGGDITIFKYLQELNGSQMKEIYKFLLDSYVILPKKIDGNDFLFVHSMPIFDTGKLNYMKETWKGFKVVDLTLREYSFMLSQRIDKDYYKKAKEMGFVTICGHTPCEGEITNMKDRGYIRIDAGCGHKKEGSKLALYCIEDDKVEYIDEKPEITLDENR